MMPLLAAIVTLTNMFGSVSVDTHGARVVSYVPAGKEEVFFVSDTGTGGMPLCWPWFAGNGPCDNSRRHGIARYMDFEVLAKECSHDVSSVALRLGSNGETRRHFPHDFELDVVVRMDERLTVTMTGCNTGKTPFPVTEAFHPYFAVLDSRKCAVEGHCTSSFSLFDPLAKRTLVFSGSGDKGLHVWRPNPQSHMSKSVSPIKADDWRRFICVENGTFKKEDGYMLAPGESHTLSRSISLPGISSSRR